MIYISKMELLAAWQKIPVRDEGCGLKKEQVWDLSKIRYALNVSRFSINCACGSKFNIDYALICKKAEFGK